MFSVTGRSEHFARWLPAVVLPVTLLLVRPWETRLGPPRDATVTGSLAVLGGMRAVAAGGAWLKANLAWERKDQTATLGLLELTVASDDRPLYFWFNAARMMAYDFPAWRSADAPMLLRERIAAEEARRALAFLERGLARHPAKGAFYLEMANIRLRAMGDKAGAAELFRLAAEQPGAPYHAARIYGELLRDLGRPQEALAWLRGILPGLPVDDPAARRDVVEQRIRELEALVGAR